MRKNLYLFATMASTAFLTVSASAATLYTNGITGNGNAYSSQNDTTGGFGNFATVYAGFNVATGSTITQFNWDGEYFNPAQKGNITGFTVNVYGDNAGTVGGLVQSTHYNGNAGEAFIGTFGGFDTYSYSGAVTPLAFSGSGWVSVVADLGFPPQWGMIEGAAATPLGYQDYFSVRSQLTTSVQIEVIGTTRVVPEPASMTALGLSVIALIRRRKASKNA